MFERRLKIMLICLTLATLMLVGRAFWVQIVRHNYWNAQAKSLSRQSMTETNRGRILDYKGRELAVDQSCLSLRVDYRVIPFELDLKTRSSKDWLYALARKRLVDRMEGFASKPISERKRLIEDEYAPLHRDIELMWNKLAKIAGIKPEEMAERRREIIRLVETRRRLAWYTKYEKAIKALPEEENEAWYAWLLGKGEVDIDKFDVEVKEQRDTHVIIPNISYELRNEILKREKEFPGVVLEAGITRYYPYGSAASQTIGTLRKVEPQDLVQNETESAGEIDGLKKYFTIDEIGRSGLEAMLESRLRGSRGMRVLDTDKEVVQDIPSQPGEDVRITIDIELQKQIEEAFKSVDFEYKKQKGPDELQDQIEMPGAAIVMDIPTGEVRAMVSYPTYDLNLYDNEYASMVVDVFRRPLANRALTNAFEPGSTVKPIIGLGAITDGLIGARDTIFCDGYLHIGGAKQKNGRCWTMSYFEKTHMEVPYADPHPNNHLMFSEAIQRSCNIYHEMLGDKLGVVGINHWFSKFGLGRPTGIGLRESPGRLLKETGVQRSDTWFAAIGQGKISATPIQMANVVATIARGGIWMKPTIVPRTKNEKLETVDLRLSLDAVREAKTGMINVVNTEAGTGKKIRMDHLLVAGKTGSAQSAPMKVMKVDDSGKPVLDEKNRPIWEEIPLGTHDAINSRAPWYRAAVEDELKRPSHSWVMCFVPANNPKLAIVAMVEYGGGGGTAAGSVVKKSLEACIKQGYLPASSN